MIVSGFQLRWLRDVYGDRVVALAAGVRDQSTVQSWGTGGKRVGPAPALRLRLLVDVDSELRDIGRKDRRAWLLRSCQGLDGGAPVAAVRVGDHRVVRAAHEFAECRAATLAALADHANNEHVGTPA